MSVNKVILVGNLGADPELKTLESGQSVCTFSIATNERWTDKNNQKQERVEWHRIVVWGKMAESSAKYLEKGRQVFIEGKLQTRSWEKDGQKHWMTEIVAQNVQFLGKGEGGGRREDGAPPPEDNDAPPPRNAGNDDIPF